MGWTGAEWTALYDVEEAEAGFSLTATNPSSGAYGLAQFINGPAEYAQYGGNSTTAAGQATAMVNYIKQRYGDPEAAWAHEEADHWYASGGPVAYASGGALETSMSAAGQSYPGIEVPDITGHQAGPAHNILVAAGLEPTAAAGQQPTWYVTGSTPAPDVSIARGAPVTILADPGAAATPIVVPDLTNYAAGSAHNILVAAGFVPTAVSTQQPWWRVTGSSPAAGTVAKAGTKVTIIATANVVQVPILAGYTAGSAHDALVTAGLYPVAAAGQQPYWYVTGTSPAAGVWVQPGAAVAILASAAAPSPAEGAGGIGAAANWPNASALMAHAEGAQDAAFWALNAAPVTGATSDQWGQWYADLGILQTNQKLISSQWGAMQPLVDSSPEGLTTTDWMNFQASTTNQAAWLQDKPTPPSGLWGQEKNVPWPAGFKTSAGKAPGSIPPSGWAAWKYAHTPWQTAVTDATNLKNDERAAYGAWEALWGPAGAISTSPPTPGLQVLPGSGGPITVNLEPLIPGGPAFPVMALTPGSLSATGSGFAAGARLAGMGLAWAMWPGCSRRAGSCRSSPRLACLHWPARCPGRPIIRGP